MKLRVEGDEGEYLLELSGENGLAQYKVSGGADDEGKLLVDEISPGIFSMLRGARSVTVRATRRGDWIETWVDGRWLRFRVSDIRDRANGNSRASARGPQEVHAPMPGKVVKLLVKEGDAVSVGTGLIIVEAMKMQNEMKAAKDGRVARVHVTEGATVGPGDTLLVIE